NTRGRASRAHLSRPAHGYLVDPARRATAGARAMQLVGPSRDQRPADDGFLSVERPDVAAGRGSFLHRKTCASAEPVDLLRARRSRTGYGYAGGAGPAPRRDRFLERPVAVQVPAAVRRHFRADYARRRRLPVRVPAPLWCSEDHVDDPRTA